MKDRCPHTGLRITTILVSMVVGVVAVILCCCIFLFLDRYRSAMVQSAQTSSAQAVSQVSNTVGNYLLDMDQAMQLVEQSMSESADSRDELLSAFLKFRPDVVAVTSYSSDGTLLDCWSLNHEPKENIFRNLSFDIDKARSSGGPYMTAPHVETIFEGYYPWVVTMTAPLTGSEEAAWVSLDLSFSSISSYINNVGIGQRGYCFLMDTDGNITGHFPNHLLFNYTPKATVTAYQEYKALFRNGAGEIIYHQMSTDTVFTVRADVPALEPRCCFVFQNGTAQSDLSSFADISQKVSLVYDYAEDASFRYVTLIERGSAHIDHDGTERTGNAKFFLRNHAVGPPTRPFGIRSARWAP